MATVIKRFRDKVTKKVFEKGSKFEGNDERVKELQYLGYLEATNEENEPDEVKLLKQTVEEIKNRTEGLSKEQYELLLNLEKETHNRKGVISHFEAMLATFQTGEGE